MKELLLFLLDLDMWTVSIELLLCVLYVKNAKKKLTDFNMNKIRRSLNFKHVFEF